MPSHKIHLAIANEVNKKLKLDNDSIMLGSVLPDLALGKRHDISHYQVDGKYEDRLANANKFIKEYKKDLDNPVMVGYLIHILTDRFYNDYFFKKYCIFNDEGVEKKVRLKNGKIKYPIKKYKQRDFAKYDKYLLKHNFVVPFEDIKCVDNVKDLSVGKFDREYLKDYIKNANYEIKKPNKYKIKSHFFYKVLSKKEMDNIYNECINYILNYINTEVKNV